MCRWTSRETMMPDMSRPVSRAGFSFLSISLVIAIITGSIAYGSQSQMVENNREALARIQERDDQYEIRISGRLAGIDEILRDQHGTLSALAATMKAIERQLSRRADRDSGGAYHGGSGQ
jgi:uncharacterized protein HemX